MSYITTGYILVLSVPSRTTRPHLAADPGVDHVFSSLQASLGQTLGRAGAVEVLGFLLVGAEYLDGGEAAHAELAGQRLVLVGVHSTHLYHALRR